MSKFNNHIVNQRFKIVYKYLIEEKKIKNKSELAEKLDTYNHIINAILKGERNLTVDQSLTLCELYQIDANFLFGLTNKMLLLEDFKIGDIQDMDFGMSKITLIHDKVRAGYAISHQNPSFYKELPQFSVPYIQGSQLVAFEIDGNSMNPTLTQGDIVICEPLDNNSKIYDNHLYIVVTDVLVAKRIQQIKTDGILTTFRLLSDNPTYQPYHVGIDEITKILKVKCRLTSHGIG